MRLAGWPFVALIVAAIGCASSTEPPNASTKENSPDAAEKLVRAVIADLLKVDSASIQMDKPISDPPLKADDLDLVEIVMELEERHGIEIADAAVERYIGGKLRKGPVPITPNQLALIVREAPKARQPKSGR
jgi:acyl carrier protein